MKRSDWWRQQYHVDRYMNELADDALKTRLWDVNANAWFANKFESHHGRIWAVKNEGPRATFAFAIPRSPEWAQ